jgi:hypothetical protein
VKDCRLATSAFFQYEEVVMRSLILFLLLALASCSASTAGNHVDKPAESQNSKGSETSRRCKSLCRDEDARDFVDMTIRVKAIFRRGFEKSELYSQKCTTPGAVWTMGTKDEV